MPRPVLKPSPEDPGFRELREMQATFARALYRPLTAADRLQSQWDDGRTTQSVLADFIRPNALLNASERVEIYSRSYWFRILDCLHDDFPALRAVLGRRKFHALSVAYLSEHPSESYTLRDLGSRLPEFIRARPELLEPHFALAYDTVRFEWAQVLAFDNEARPPLEVDALLGADPATIHFGLQPYLVLLELGFPLDDFVLAVHKREAIRSTASNAVAERTERLAIPRVRRPKPEASFMAVHRLHNTLYYKRLHPAAFAILTSLQHGQSLADACAAGAAVAPPDFDLVTKIREWFHDWVQLGWLCQLAA